MKFFTTHIRRCPWRFDVDALVLNLDAWLGSVENAVKGGVKATRGGNEGREAREMQGHHEMERGLEGNVAEESGGLRQEQTSPPSDAMWAHQVVGMRTKNWLPTTYFPLPGPKVSSHRASFSGLMYL